MVFGVEQAETGARVVCETDLNEHSSRKTNRVSGAANPTLSERTHIQSSTHAEHDERVQHPGQAGLRTNTGVSARIARTNPIATDKLAAQTQKGDFDTSKSMERSQNCASQPFKSMERSQSGPRAHPKSTERSQSGPRVHPKSTERSQILARTSAETRRTKPSSPAEDRKIDGTKPQMGELGKLFRKIGSPRV